MRAWWLAAVAAVSVGMMGAALAQPNVAAERRAGFRQMQGHMEAIAAVVQTRGDQAQIASRVDQMIPFYQALPGTVPAASLAPPIPQGTGEGQTRALAAIEANRADFAARTQNMIEMSMGVQKILYFVAFFLAELHNTIGVTARIYNGSLFCFRTGDNGAVALQLSDWKAGN